MLVSKNSGVSPKMHGENNGESYFLMDYFGGKTPIFWNIHIVSTYIYPGCFLEPEPCKVDPGCRENWYCEKTVGPNWFAKQSHESQTFVEFNLLIVISQSTEVIQVR